MHAAAHTTPLMASQARQWVFNQEEGAIDRARLATLATAPRPLQAGAGGPLHTKFPLRADLQPAG